MFLCTTCLLSLFLSACSEGSRPLPANQQTAYLNLIRSGVQSFDIQVAGRKGMRAVQAQVVYEPSALRITKVEAGQDARRIDRLFFPDLETISGALTLGITDTRQVLLPARGSLFRVSFDLLDSSATTKVTLKNPIGAADGGDEVLVFLTNTEVTLP